jgi:hypothetical protein
VEDFWTSAVVMGLLRIEFTITPIKPISATITAVSSLLDFVLLCVRLDINHFPVDWFKCLGPPNGWHYPLVGGMRQRRFDEICLKTRRVLQVGCTHG